MARQLDRCSRRLTRVAAAAPGDRPALLGDTERPARARPVPTDPHELDVAYAEASLKLLQLDLQKMTDLQSRVHGSITASQFDRVDGMVRVAEDNLPWSRQATFRAAR